jgi:hypothetical protein
MQEKIAKRHKQAVSNRDLGKYLKYALGRRTHRQKPPVLVEVTSEGTKVYGGKQKVEAKEKELTEEHLGKIRERWYRNTQGALLPQFRSKNQGRQWRKQETGGRTTHGGRVESDTDQTGRYAAVREDGGGQGRGHSGTATLQRYIHERHSRDILEPWQYHPAHPREVHSPARSLEAAYPRASRELEPAWGVYNAHTLVGVPC